MTAAKKTEAAAQKSQYLTFGLTKHHECYITLLKIFSLPKMPKLQL